MVPSFIWIVVAIGGAALLAAWWTLRRLWSRALVRAQIPPNTRRVLSIAADVCMVFIGLAWFVGGIVGFARG